MIFPSLNQVLIKSICLIKLKLDIENHIGAVFECEARKAKTRINLCLDHHLSYDWILCLDLFNCKKCPQSFFKLCIFTKVRTCKYLLNIEIIKINTRKNWYFRILVMNTPQFKHTLICYIFNISVNNVNPRLKSLLLKNKLTSVYYLTKIESAIQRDAENSCLDITECL